MMSDVRNVRRKDEEEEVNDVNDGKMKEEEIVSVRQAGKLQLEGCVIIFFFFYYYVLCLRGDISTASASGAAVFLSLSLAPAFFLPNEIPV